MKDPLIGTCPPLARETVMRKDSPVVEPLGTPVQDSEVVTPASIAVLVVLHVNGALVEDPKVIVAAVRLVPAVPVLLKLSTQVLVLDEQLADPDTLAVDVNDPNRPNTNPAIAMAALFNMQFRGYLLALAFKYLPMLPLFYLVFIQDKAGKHEVQVKTLKLAGLVTLAGADLLLFYVVGINNLHALLFAP